LANAVAQVCAGAVLAVVAALGLTGCAGSPSGSVPGSTPAATTRPRATVLPPITVRRSGGLAGVTDVVTVDPQGAWVATDKTGHRRTGRLTVDQMAAVSARAADPRLAAEADRSAGPTRCADAFTYDVTVATLRVTYTDCPSDSGLPEATIALVAQVRSATG
jgi:hypothetical protein